jgi:hypothetical protein
MRIAILAAGLSAVVGLSACGPAKDDTAANAPAAPKYVGRSQTMYQGQELISKVDSGTISVGKNGAIEMTANGSVPGSGYKNPGFLKRILYATPKDGIYEMDVVADRPAAAGAAAATPIEAKGPWEHPNAGVKGVRFIAHDNSVLAMLPAK